MANMKCPECGERVRVREDGKRLRCPECGKSFRPLEEVEERKSPRSRRKQAASKSSRTKTTAFIIGGLALVAVAAVTVVLIVSKGSGTNADWKPVDSAKVTPANFRSLKPGMTLPEIESILGGSRSSSANDLRDELRAAYFAATELDSAMGSAPGLLSQISTWRRWEGKDLRVWVAFVQAKDEPRAAFCTSLEPFGQKWYKHEPLFVTSGGRELDKAADNRKQEDAIRNDAKWVRGAKSRELLFGEWRDDTSVGYIFEPNGKLTEPGSSFEIPADQQPTYRIADERHLEITWPPPLASIPGQPHIIGPTTRRFEYHVNRDELAMIESSDRGILGARLLYRMPVRPGSPGETKLVAPILADLKGGNAAKQQEAYFKLTQMAKGLAVALPTLIELLRSPNETLMSYSASIIGEMKENAVPVVPTLIGMLRDRETKRALAAARALGQIGPAAKEALPALREVLKKSKDGQLQNDVDQAIRLITTRKY